MVGVAVALEADALRKSFRDQRAVDDLSLRVEEGEIYGFLGPNGAGKTTTIRMLLGLAKPDAGQARILGVDPREDPVAAREQVGYLPEALSFYPTLTGRQTLRFFADLRGVPRERADELLATAGLDSEAEKRVSEYSRGASQRLGLAQALLGDPAILILDEPLSALDPLAQRQVKALLQTRVRHGVTLLFSSHQLAEVQELADRVGIMRGGRLLAEDTVEGLRARVGLKGVLVLTLRRPSDELERAVREMAGVEHARLDGARLVITVQGRERFEVAKAVHELGGDVVGMETHEPSLEDVFLRVTEGRAE